VSITVVHENQPPVVNPGAAACLWPPNHKFADVPITGATDPDGDTLTYTITKIMSDEPAAAVTGAGGKTHAPDASGVGTGIATLLRTERSGNNNGRMYTISFIADDGMGGSSAGTMKVCVPHDQSQKCQCIDDGPNYDATA
ncbi:MAG TPA: Ig-like domain-containing protein, partial [Methanomicrobiales archaeon]|nr:Ig-like domain-containing protein [Methanomicrobiales archaeon]